MSRFLIERYKNIAPYVPGEQPQEGGYVKLNTNESAYPPSDKAIKSIGEEELLRLKLYSDPEAKRSTSAVAKYYGIGAENVLMTNGSDEALAFCYAAFCDGAREAVSPEISYGFYPVFCKLLSLKYNFIPLDSNYKVDVSAFCGINKNVVIANPNAPTGIALTLSEIERIVSSNPENVVIIDEAYVDFGAETSVPLTKKYDNLLVIQTFSKSRMLAGARLGAVIGNAALIEDVKKIKYSFNPYNVNRLTDTLGACAIEDTEYFDECRKKIIATRERATDIFTRLGFTVLPSSANFLFVKHDGLDGGKYYETLKQKGVLVRHFDNPKISDFVRVTIGTPDEMDVLFAKTEEILKAEKLL